MTKGIHQRIRGFKVSVQQSDMSYMRKLMTLELLQGAIKEA